MWSVIRLPTFLHETCPRLVGLRRGCALLPGGGVWCISSSGAVTPPTSKKGDTPTPSRFLWAGIPPIKVPMGAPPTHFQERVLSRSVGQACHPDWANQLYPPLFFRLGWGPPVSQKKGVTPSPRHFLGKGYPTSRYPKWHPSPISGVGFMTETLNIVCAGSRLQEGVSFSCSEEVTTPPPYLRGGGGALWGVRVEI